MKKILIGLLVLIPLLIVGAVLLATELISISPDIGVTSVNIIDGRNSIESLEEVNLSGLSTRQYQMYATTLPKKAHNKKLHWHVENGTKFDPDFAGDAIATVNDDGLVTIHSYGIFYIVVTTDDGGYTDKCMFIVNGDIAESVYFSNGAVEVNELFMNTGGVEALDVKVRPVDASIEYAIWASDNQSVLTVDGNGIVTAKSAGTANVTVRLKSPDRFTTDENGIETLDRAATELSATVRITVNASAFKYYAFYTVADTVALSAFANGNDCSIKGTSAATISGGNLNMNGETSVTVQRGGEEIIVLKCADGDLAFENSEVIAREGATVKIGRLPVNLKCVYRATNAGVPTGITYESDDESIATVDENGNVTALADGNVTITARSGDKFVNISLRVVTPVTYIVLTDSGFEERRGIAKECIYGNMYYNDAGEIVYTRQITVAKPENSVPTDYVWQTDSPEVATIDENGIITYAPDFTGEKTITVTVFSKNTAYASDTVSTVYIFKVRKGMNVHTRDEIRKASDAKNMDIFLRNDIHYTSADGGGWFINLWTNLYGNGYTIDYDNEDSSEGGEIISVRASNVTVRNITIRSALPPSDELISNQSYTRGRCIEVHPVDTGIMRNDSYENVKIQYCILEYAKWCLALFGGDVTVDGCVIRNTSVYGTYISTDDRSFTDRDAEGNPVGEPYTYTSNINLTLKNSILAKSVGPLVGNASWTFEPQGNGYITIEGFLEMYNWQNIVNMDALPLEDSVSPQLATLIRELISTELGKDKYDHFAQKQELTKSKYFNLGILTLGVVGKSNTTVVGALAENDIDSFEYTIINLPPVTFYSNTEDCPRRYDETYTLDEKTCARLRGEQP